MDISFDIHNSFHSPAKYITDMPRPEIDDDLWRRLNRRRESPQESTQDVIERLLEEDA